MSETDTKKAEPISVKMDDGRTVEFGAKSRLIKTPIENPDGTLQVRMDFVNGETRLFTLRPDMLAKFALHGASQKLGDEIAGVAKLEDAIEAVDQLIQRLDSGPTGWSQPREAGSGLSGVSNLVKALVESTKAPVAQVREYLTKLDAKTKLALRNSAELAPIIKRLEAEAEARAAARGKSAPTVDVQAHLSGLQALAAQPTS
jgi:hypothetical protein